MGTGIKITFPIFGIGKIAFPTFGYGNEMLVFPEMVGNWNDF